MAGTARLALWQPHASHEAGGWLATQWQESAEVARTQWILPNVDRNVNTHLIQSSSQHLTQASLESRYQIKAVFFPTIETTLIFLLYKNTSLRQL